MRAYVYKTRNLQDILGSGFLTNEYKSIRNLRKYGLAHLHPGTYRLQVYYNWDNRYGMPDLVEHFIVT